MARRRVTKARRGRRSGSNIWMGFRSGSTQANLDTATSFELVPTAASSRRLRETIVVRRVVGQINIRNQSGVTLTAGFGACIQAVHFANDQTTIQDQVSSVSTDPDDFSRKGIKWWQNWAGQESSGVPADYDDFSQSIPVDLKMRLLLTRNMGLELRMDAVVTARVRAGVDLRVLVWVP